MKDISVIEQEYASKISDYNDQVNQIQNEIDNLSASGNSTASAKSALISDIEALKFEIENARTNLDELRNTKTAAQDSLSNTPQQIDGVDNPDYAALIQQISQNESLLKV